ncbi:hypothetical protein BABINDRAFT_167520 [Babjeviella inositovora NRRL Y-12698]|uniref:BTB domain-containing protein n=1 Tax=Babjeviella inositovora NRRL Y-12698 TaxID=984486 RepID=A0A1E3QMV9_9ASCO|nr:uncharacterized protein BABINDRAFT_167520 [Babjeviella inositovora NRRL Y-12698]ODQ78968.1 hypothetical protein BABINDRAFT_167520 [Babjeviella inositovora NRRL Y-12698]
MTPEPPTPIQPCLTSGDHPLFRVKSSATPVEDLLFLFGGFDEDDALDSNIYLLDLTTDRWTTHHDTVPREGHSSVYHQPSGQIIVFGGVPDEAVQREQLMFYDLRVNQWVASPSSVHEPRQRGRHAACLSEDGTKMFISGGLDDSLRPYDDLYCFDLATRLWLTTGPRTFISRFDHFMTCMGNKIYSFGGLNSDMNHVNAVISWFDLETNTTGEIRIQKDSMAGDHVYLLSTPEVVLDAVIPLWTAGEHPEPCIGCYDLSRLRYNVLLLGAFTPLKDFRWRHVFRHGETLCLLGYPLVDTETDARLSHIIRLSLCDLGMRYPSFEEPDLTLASDFTQFFDDAQWTDFEITAMANDRVSAPIRAHRAILLARWPHFRRVMASGMLEANTGMLHVPEPVEWVHGLVRYLYTNHIGSEDLVDVISGILVLANVYALDHLRSLCLAKMYDYTYSSRFTFDDYVQLWERASLSNELILKHNVLQVIQLNWGKVVRCAAFAHLARELLLELTLEASGHESVILSASHTLLEKQGITKMSSTLAFTSDVPMEPVTRRMIDTVHIPEQLLEPIQFSSPSRSPSAEITYLTPVQRMDVGRASPLSSASSFLH